MGFVKICPGCNTQNPSTEMMCTRCLGDISGISPSPIGHDSLANQKSEDREGKRGAPQDGDFLLLEVGDGREIRVKNGDIVGRKAVGGDIIDDFKSVSRKHARFTCEEGRWFIEDLNSTNESFLDDVRIEKNRKVELKRDQKLTLSSSFETKVVF